MPSFFVNAFKTAKKFSPEAAAIKRATLLVDQAKAKNPAGILNDPSVYDQAIKLLENYSFDPAVLTKQAQLQTAKNALTDKLNDQNNALSTLKSSLTNAQYQLGKNNAASPEVVIQKTAALYDLYAQQLSHEIDSRKANGESYDSLVDPLQKAQSQAQDLASLSRTTLAPSDTPSLVKQQFGFLAKTDPDTGKVISFSLQPINANSTSPGYIRSNSTYGGVPLYLNAVRDPNNNNDLVGKLGDMVFKGANQNTTSSDSTTPNGMNKPVLELQNADKRSFGQKFMDILPGHHVDKDNTAAGGVNKVGDNFELKGKINPDMFKDASLPKGQVGQDSNGNYYLMNNDGKLFQSSDPSVIGQYMGKTAQDVKTSAYFLTAKDVQTMKSQQDPTQAGSSILTAPPKSPLQQSAPPSSMNVPSASPQGADQNATEQPASSQELSGGPEGPAPATTTGRDRAVLQPRGAEKQEQTTKTIVNPPSNVGFSIKNLA